jgi:lysophospholipid acyltransferase (LPLAT)-like uncharacterized protein
MRSDRTDENDGGGVVAAFRRLRGATSSVRRPLKPFANRVLVPLASFLMWLFIAATNRTVRFEVIGPRPDDALRGTGEKIVYVFFHSRLFSMFRMLRGRRVAVLVAVGDIGDVIANTARWFGHVPARGGRSGRATAALVEMIREVRRGRTGAFAVDGSRGPRDVVKPGALYVAQKTGAVVVPVATSAFRHWHLGIWDRHEIPAPFTKMIALMGEPVRVPRGASREEIDETALRIEETLLTLGEMAEDRVRRYNI